MPDSTQDRRCPAEDPCDWIVPAGAREEHMRVCHPDEFWAQVDAERDGLRAERDAETRRADDNAAAYEKARAELEYSRAVAVAFVHKSRDEDLATRFGGYLVDVAAAFEAPEGTPRYWHACAVLDAKDGASHEA